jgi:hypothetical protein
LFQICGLLWVSCSSAVFSSSSGGVVRLVCGGVFVAEPGVGVVPS